MRTDWDEASIERIVTLFRANKSIRTIAQEVGLTPGAISGKLGRLNVRREMPQQMLNQRNTQQTKIQRKQSVRVPSTTSRPKFDATRYDLPPQGIEDVARKKLIDLERGECNWPVGDPRDSAFGFCALPATPGRNYCEHHCRRATSRDDNNNDTHR